MTQYLKLYFLFVVLTLVYPLAQAQQFLNFPLQGFVPDNSEVGTVAAVSAVMDHSVPLDSNRNPLFYSSNGTVEAYTGEIGLKFCGLTDCIDPSSPKTPGYKQTSGTNFIVNGGYTGGGKNCGADRKSDCAQWLFYEGHPGFDYPIGRKTPVYAPADGLAFIPDCDPVTNSRDCTGMFNFTFTGAKQFWRVPSDVTSINVDVLGAQGGGNGGDPLVVGGKGGRVQTTLAVTPGETLVINVGGRGGDLVDPNTGGAGGFNGGGDGGIDNIDGNGPAGGGGGASDIRRGGTRVVVAGGGGGAECCEDANGGAGGDVIGMDGGGFNPGRGGTQSNGGAGGHDCHGNGGDGILGKGGVGGNGNRAGGGGGGGYYGGGGGGGCTYGSGGGGGSSYSAGVNTIHTQGFRYGDGQVTITVVTPGQLPPGSFVDGDNVLAIDHQNSYSTWYLHMGDVRTEEDFRLVTCPGKQPIALKRGDGQHVPVTPLCTIGGVGNKAIYKNGLPANVGYHLHFEARLGLTSFACRRPACVPVDPYGAAPNDPYPIVSTRLWK